MIEMSDEPMVKTVRVPLAPDSAFRVFTQRIGEWWPMATHSVSGDAASGVRFEPYAGGRLVEVTTAGEECVWGTVLVWDDPSRLVLSWHPGRAPETAQEVDGTFVADADGTAVRLEHRGWDLLGPAVAEQRGSYDGGWDLVLGQRYVAAAAAAA